MKFGLSDSDWELVESLIVGPLKAHGAHVWVFGSRARGTERPYSDLDLLYSVPLDRELSSGFLSRMREAVEESRLPIKVDLVAEGDLAESYRAGVQRDRIAL